MPRAKRQRDYAAEYARRLQRERERAAAEGRPFSRARARGHGSPESERQRERVRKLWRTNAAMYGKNYPGWASVVAAASNTSWDEVETTLRRQQENTSAYRLGNPIPGRVGYDVGKVSTYPIEFFWYHGAG